MRIYDLLNLGQDSRLRYQFDNNFWWRFFFFDKDPCKITSSRLWIWIFSEIVFFARRLFVEDKTC